MPGLYIGPILRGSLSIDRHTNFLKKYKHASVVADLLTYASRS
jgi:hypothetical protein